MTKAVIGPVFADFAACRQAICPPPQVLTRAKTRGSRPDSPCRPRRAGGRLRAAGIALIAATPLVAQALPEDALLAGISGDFRQPQLRCEWIASRFDSIAEQLSLYREELGAFVVTVDGVTIGDSTNGAVLSVEFESRRSGPGSAMLALDRPRAPSRASTRIPPCTRRIRNACR